MIDPGTRSQLADQQREVMILRQQMARVPDRFGGSRPALQMRLAKTAEKSGEAYPTAADNNKYRIVFVDGSYDSSAIGTEAPTYKNRQTDAEAIAIDPYYPQLIPEGSLVVVQRQNDEWWIVRKPSAADVSIYGSITISGGSSPLEITGTSKILFDNDILMSNTTRVSNGIEIDSGSPDGVYLCLLQVYGNVKEDESLSAFSSGEFTTDQNTALDTQFQRDYLATYNWEAYIGTPAPIGLLKSHVHARTSSGISAYGANPMTSITCHYLQTLSAADSITGWVTAPAGKTFRVYDAILSVMYYAPA